MKASMLMEVMMSVFHMKNKLASNQLIPPAPFSWEEKGERRFEVLSNLFSRIKKSFGCLIWLFSPSLFKRRGRGMSSDGVHAPRVATTRVKTLTVLMCALFLVTLLPLGCDRSEKVEQQKPQAASEVALSFTDVTASAGLSEFRHVTGAIGDKWFPESMGSGGGFIDYDGDGWQDILLVGGGRWAKDKTQPPQALWLFRNNGDGSFSNKTNEAGLGNLSAYGFGIAVADYDNDGDQDFYFTTLHHNMLFRNDPGVFTEVSKAANLAGEATWSSSAIFFDADKDGWLDLYYGNYVDWSAEKDLWCTLDGKTKSYCTPELYKGVPGRFYRNNGAPNSAEQAVTFTDQTEAAGFTQSPGKTLGLVECDFNRDGWPDLVVSNDTQRNLLYKNDGDGTFTELGAFSGVAYDENGRARAGMGIDAGVIDNTGAETIFIGNFSKEMIGVYRYIGNDLFTDRAPASKIGRPSLMTLTFALFVFDVDLDGDLDLFAANGHVQEDIEITQDGIAYREPPHLFLNDGNGFFADEAPKIGGVLQQPLVGRGASYADYDRDGDLDVLVTENGGPAHLWRNEPSNGHHYLRVHVQGTKTNRDGIGTRIVAKVDTLRMERCIRTGSSFLASLEKTATFGLGAKTQVDSLLVYWPSGRVDRFGAIAADRELLLIEGADELREYPKPQAVVMKQ